MQFQLLVKVELVGSKEHAPTEEDAAQLVSVALQTIFNDGYENEEIFFQEFRVIPMPSSHLKEP